MSDYKPTSFNGEPLTTAKLNQLSSNVQYLFDRSPKIRYASSGITRDNGIKVIAGKSPFSVVTGSNFCYVNVNFGSFFTAGCKPIVSTQVEAQDAWAHRSHVAIQSLNGANSEVDHIGFTAIVANEPYTQQGPGFVHWIAVGF